MIFTRLTITDFGVYQGVNEFDLRPRVVNGQMLPLVIFGGKNGAGKTTILEAIRLCLYGRSALGPRIRRVDYETYIEQRMHKGSKETLPARSTRIGLMFEHVHAGVRSHYDAVRAWNFDGSLLREDVSIYKDGSILTDILPEHWSDFLRDLIPPGVADLFFFDGEQIQSLADDDTESSSLASAINGLLNLDLINRLKADLALYLKQEELPERSELQREADETDSAYRTLQEVYGEKKQDRAGFISQLDMTKSQIERARQDLLREGAIFVENRTRTEERLRDVNQDIEQISATLRELVGELLPFALSPQWSMRLKKRLETEARFDEERISYDIQRQKAEEIEQSLGSVEFRQSLDEPLSPTTWLAIIKQVGHILEPQQPNSNIATIHPVSAQQRETLFRWIQRVLREVPKQTEFLNTRLEQLEAERSQLQQSLKQIPEDEIANPLIEQFHRLSEKKGKLQEQIRQKDEELARFEYQLADLDRKRKRAWQRLADAGDVDLRVQRAAKVQVILDEYLAQITVTKLKELEERVAHYFNLLSRKQMLVQEVQVDPKRFIVRLYGQNRRELPKSSLSAGEKQLYAMALLWALRSVSGRNLPIIVDTPMGRLDSDHRRSLLMQFFPQAANQLVLLSTDTELDEEAYEYLSPYVSHAYTLNFESEHSRTRVDDGYLKAKISEIAV
ncbi:DNA sulfur modification protein DndD [bacterium]|nr:DNA sulfur modification protein DndD [bacterium]